MQRRFVVAFAALAWGAAAVAIACGGSSEDTPAPPVPPDLDGAALPPPNPQNPPPGPTNTPPGNYVPAPAGVGKAYCDALYGGILGYLDRCCNATEKMSYSYQFPAFVMTSLQELCSGMLEPSIAKGRVVYDPALASKCSAALAPLATAACGGDLATGVVAGSVGACATAFAGTVGTSHPCAGPQECSAGNTCVGYAILAKDGRTADGMCRPPPGVGQACAQSAVDSGGIGQPFPFITTPECGSNAYCPSPIGAACAAQKGAGAACTDAKECSTEHCYMGKCASVGPVDAGACASHTDCVSGLDCDKTDAAAPGSCRPKKSAPAACSSSECKGMCIVPDGGTTGTCVSFCGSG